MDKISSFLGILLAEIGPNGIRTIILEVIIGNKVNKIQTRYSRFLRLGLDFWHTNIIGNKAIVKINIKIC